ncbi:MAG: hypothetical protein M3065_15805, partial [Actinomycetota bacterium]|nr:hypothetical protein [Actinomycetota bacterium]
MLSEQPGNPYTTDAEHFNGKTWTEVPVSADPNLSAVLAVSPTNAWAVGDTISHWNGTTWTRVPNVLTFNSGLHLSAITELSATDLWAVGYNSNGPANSNYPWTSQTFAEHFNGTSWSAVPTSNPANLSGPGNILWGVSSTT